jgi:hypothetical protein
MLPDSSKSQNVTFFLKNLILPNNYSYLQEKKQTAGAPFLSQLHRRENLDEPGFLSYPGVSQ